MTTPKSAPKSPVRVFVFLIILMTINALIGFFFAWKFQKEAGGALLWRQEAEKRLIQKKSDLHERDALIEQIDRELKTIEKAQNRARVEAENVANKLKAAEWVNKTERSHRQSLGAKLALWQNDANALGLAIQAFETDANVHSRSAVMTALEQDRHIASFEDVTTFGVSPDSKKVAVSFKDHTFRVIDGTHGKTLTASNLHKSPVTRFKFSADSNFLTTSADDAKLAIWNLSAGGDPKVLEFDSNVTDVKFQSNHETLLIATEDRAAYLHNLADGKRKAVYVGHLGAVKQVEFLGEDLALTFSADNAIRLFARDSGKLIQKVDHVGNANATSMRVLEQKQMLLLIDTSTSSIDILDLQDLTIIGTIEHGRTNNSWMEVESSGKRILALAKDGLSIDAWNLADPSQQKTIMKLLDRPTSVNSTSDHFIVVNHLNELTAYDRSGKVVTKPFGLKTSGETIALASSTNILIRSRHELVLIDFMDRLEEVLVRVDRRTAKMVAVNDNNSVLWLDDQGTASLVLLDIAQGWPGIPSGLDNREASRGQIFNVVGDQHILIAPGDGSIALHSRNGSTKVRTLKSESAPPAQAAFSPDGKHIAVAYSNEQFRTQGTITRRSFRLPINGAFAKDSCVRVFEVETGKEVHHSGPNSFGGFANNHTSLAFHPGGAWLAASTRNGVRIWSWADKTIDRTIWMWGSEISFRFGADGSTIMVMGSNGQLFECATGKQMQSLDNNNSSFVSAECTKDLAKIIALESNGTARVWDVESGAIRHFFGSDDEPIVRCLLSPDEQSVVAANARGELWTYNMTTGKIVSKKGPFPRGIRDFKLSADGKFVAVVDGKGNWSLSEFPAWTDVLMSASQALNAVGIDFTPDSKNVVLTDDRGNLVLWPIDVNDAIKLRK